MASDFTPITLGKILSFANGRSSPERFESGANPVYGSNGVIGYSNEHNANENSIIIGRVGSYCGSLYLAKQRCWVTDNAIRANAAGGNNPRFLFYLLGTLSLNNWRAGSGQPLLNQEILSSIPTFIPEPIEQQAIASVLGALDDKIDLNRRMNETLEAMARAIFKDWFVDFGPVRAKTEGRPPYLAPELWSLFPDALDDEDKPVGWRLGTIGDLAEIGSGKRPSSRQDIASAQVSVPLWGGNGPMAFVPEPLFNTPIILTGRVGTLGSVFRITTPCWPSDNTLVLRPTAPELFQYCYYCLKAVDFVPLNRGSTQPLLTQTDLKSQEIILPSQRAVVSFSETIGAFFERMDKAQNESTTLAELRDLLLPKLMSGEIRLTDAEKAVEAAL